MKIASLVILVLFISCQKEKTESKKAVEVPTKKTETAVTNQEGLPKTDTISISDGENSKSKDYIIAELLNQQIDKDSTINATYQLVFYKNKTKTTSTKITIKGYNKGSYWSATYGFSFDGEKNSPFINIKCGVEACDYGQNHYLYYLENNNLQLVYEWYTISSSGYGIWNEFTPANDSDTKSFYCKTVAFSPTDHEEEESGILKYSDSTLFEFKDNHWVSKLLSEKDKDYFEKKMTFEELSERNRLQPY